MSKPQTINTTQKSAIRDLIYHVHKGDFAKATDAYKVVVREKLKSRYDQIVEKIREPKQ